MDFALTAGEAGSFLIISEAAARRLAHGYCLFCGKRRGRKHSIGLPKQFWGLFGEPFCYFENKGMFSATWRNS